GECIQVFDKPPDEIFIHPSFSLGARGVKIKTALKVLQWMEGATHLRGNPNARVSITHTGDMDVAIPRLGRINPVPCRAHDIMIAQTFGHRTCKTRVKYPVFQREPAAPGKPKRP